jgi:hypothetical protein
MAHATETAVVVEVALPGVEPPSRARVGGWAGREGLGGEELGTVEHVLQVPELDVFDGIVVTTAGGLRFADADQMADITDRHVLLNLSVEDAERLGQPQAPVVYQADPLSIPAARCMTGSVVRSAVRPLERDG